MIWERNEKLGRDIKLLQIFVLPLWTSGCLWVWLGDSEFIFDHTDSPGLDDFYASQVINITFPFTSPITRLKGS